MSEKIFVIPPSRTRYLSEIAESNRAYDTTANTQVEVAQKLYGIYKTLESVLDTAPVLDKAGIASESIENVIEANKDFVRLLVSEFDGNKVIQIDISEPIASVIDLVTGITNPTGLFLHGHDLYICVFGKDKIVKFLFPVLNSEELNDPEETLKLFPNPSTSHIQISGLDKTKKYTITNTLGQIVRNGISSNNEQINIENLDSGVYFLKFEKTTAIRFIKE